MRARPSHLMALAAMALCLAWPGRLPAQAGAPSDSAPKYFQNSRERLIALSAEAGKVFDDRLTAHEKITVNYLTIVGGLRAASADLLTQLLDINVHMRDPADRAYVQAKLDSLRQDLPQVIKTDIKHMAEVAGTNKNQDLARLADEFVKELKVLLNNLDNLSFSQP